MYSLALMTFDAHLQPAPGPSAPAAAREKHARSQRAMTGIHRLVLDNFSQIKPAEYNKENYDQVGGWVVGRRCGGSG